MKSVNGTSERKREVNENTAEFNIIRLCQIEIPVVSISSLEHFSLKLNFPAVNPLSSRKGFRYQQQILTFMAFELLAQQLSHLND